MSDKDNDTTIHHVILDQLKRSDANQIRIFEKLDEYGQTMARLTTTVELHQKYSVNLEKEQKEQRENITKIKEEQNSQKGKIDDICADLNVMGEEIENINTHVNEVKLWVKIFKPTKTKVAAAITLLSLFGGNEALKTKAIKDLITSFLVPTESITPPAPSDGATVVP